ncbi:hypothetical protein ACFL4F_00815 [Candidatus Margulisiibacteriota bacterium]
MYPVHCHGLTADISNTYLYDYTQPPLFQPSLNGEFTSLSDSVTTVRANPAGLMKVNTIEVAVGMSGLVRNPIASRSDTYFINDQVMDAEDFDGATANIALRFTDDRTATTPEARQIPLLDEYSKGGGINYFGLAFRVSENLGFGFARERPTALSINMNATMPQMVDINFDMRGFNNIDGSGDGLLIRDDGFIEVWDDNAPVATSDAAVYDRFLDQSTNEVNWINVNLSNTVVNQQSIVVTAGFKTGPIDWGVNVIPITYNMNIDNNISIVSDDNNGNIGFLYPDLNESFTSFEAMYWVTMESTVADGYISKEVATRPTQEAQIAGAVVAGRYSGSALRMDIGAMWEPNDGFSAGFMYENFNGAKLILSGTNVVHYVQNYIDQNSEMPTVEGEVWYPYYDAPTHETEAEKFIMLGSTLPPIVLPSKLKFGFAFKKPLVFALDWEQWQSEVGINTDPGSPEAAAIAKLSNLTFLKAGLESRLFFLPILFRGSLTMMMKPSTDDPDMQNSFDDLFSTVPILPIEGNMYFSLNVGKGEVGIGGGGGGLPLTAALGADMTKIAKIYYTDIYYAEEFWRVSYQMTTDPILTGIDSDFSGESIDMNSLKLATTSTLSIGLKF